MARLNTAPAKAEEKPAKSKKVDKEQKNRKLGLKEHEGQPFAVDDSTRILKVIEDGDELICVSISTWKGKQSLDVRRYYEQGDKWRPGKGLRVKSADAAEALIEVLSNLDLDLG